MSSKPKVPPPNYVLQEGEVHVWRVPIESTLAAAEKSRAVLSKAELDRANRFVFERDQARFMSCRAALRKLLARYTGLAAEKLVFEYGTQGKPSIDKPAGWQFNVSHSDELAAIAVTRDAAIGIDIERIDPRFPFDETASEIMTSGELAAFDELPSESQPAHFFQLWTLKEALIKSSGIGFSLDPRAIEINLAAATPKLISAPDDLASATLHIPNLEENFSAGLAMLNPVSSTSIFTFSTE